MGSSGTHSALKRGLRSKLEPLTYALSSFEASCHRFLNTTTFSLRYKPLFVLETLLESDMRASSALVLSLFLLCSQRHLASAILPPFAIAAVEAMWAKRNANSATSTTK